MKEIVQKKGKSWRKYEILPEAVKAEYYLNGKYSSKFIEFSKTGFRVRDYDLLPDTDRNRVGNIIIACFLIYFMIIGLALSMPEFSDNKNIQAFTGFLLMAFFIGCIYYGFRQKNKLNLKKIYFESRGYLTFYYRNQKEIDVVESFIGEIDDAIVGYSKGRLIAAIEKKEQFLLPWLEGLHERGVMSSEEYLDLKEKIKMNDKKTKKKKT